MQSAKCKNYLPAGLGHTTCFGTTWTGGSVTWSGPVLQLVLSPADKPFLTCRKQCFDHCSSSFLGASLEEQGWWYLRAGGSQPPIHKMVSGGQPVTQAKCMHWWCRVIQAMAFYQVKIRIINHTLLILALMLIILLRWLGVSTVSVKLCALWIYTFQIPFC